MNLIAADVVLREAERRFFAPDTDISTLRSRKAIVPDPGTVALGAAPEVRGSK